MDQLRLEDLDPSDRSKLPYNHPLLDDYASRKAKELGIDPHLVLAIKNAGEKSGSKSVSSANARGVMQTIPATGQSLGVKDPTDPVQSIDGGAKYLAQLASQLKTNDPKVLAAAYHAGPASPTVSGNMQGSPKTEAYVDRVSNHVNTLKEASKIPQLPPGVTYADLSPEDKIQYAAAMRKVDPKSYDPTYGSSLGENMLAGAGKFFSDTGSGLRQLAATPVNAVTQALNGKDLIPQDYTGEQDRRVTDDALMHTWGGNLGYGGAAAASLALPGGVVAKGAQGVLRPAIASINNPVARAAVARYAPVAVTGGALSTLTPTTAPGERTENAAMGAALGPVFDRGGELLGNAARPVAHWIGDHVNLGPFVRPSFNAQATPNQRQVVARTIANDVPVYPQQLDSPGIALPKGQADEQAAALTRAMNSTHGSASDDIHGALADSRERLGDAYEQILGGKTIHLNTPSGPAPVNGLGTNGPMPPSNFVQRLMDIRNNYLNSKPMSSPDTGLLGDIDAAIAHASNGGTLTGRQYQNYLRDYSAAGSRARKTSIVNNVQTGSPDHEAASAYGQMIDLLHDQAATAIPQWQQDFFNQTNRQFRNMKTLEGLAPADLESNFNPTTVARKLQRTPGLTFDAGDPTLQDLAQFGSTYMGMDANQGKQSLWQQGKQFAKTAAPYIATGLGEGAIIASGTGHDNEGDGPLTKTAKAAVLPLSVMAAVAAGRGSLNTRRNLNHLNEPRGAIPDWLRIQQPAPAVEALIRDQIPMDDTQEAP